MKRLIAVLALAAALVACTPSDNTGASPDGGAASPDGGLSSPALESPSMMSPESMESAAPSAS
jgi:hypothetical protein